MIDLIMKVTCTVDIWQIICEPDVASARSSSRWTKRICLSARVQQTLSKVDSGATNAGVGRVEEGGIHQREASLYRDRKDTPRGGPAGAPVPDSTPLTPRRITFSFL